jgi:TfuA protein
MHEIAIFLGPTLELSAARAVLDADYLPPITRGDLGRLGAHVKTVGIIDGEFYQSLAVSPKEVLPLLDRGIYVYGASSMGALRAAETYPFGMIGVGKIFEWYRDGVIDADDEVALTYDPVTYRPTSVPLVNIRFCLQAAVSEGVIAQSTADEIVRAVEQLYFPSRSYQVVSQLRPELEDFIRRRRPDQKREDALLLLQTIANAG